MNSANIAAPPSLRPSEEVEHTRRRRRAVDGSWARDLREALVHRKGDLVANAWGQIEPTGCVIRELAQAVSVLYVETPSVEHPTAEPAMVAAFAERLRLSGLWNALAEAQFQTEALNEAAVFPNLRDGKLTYRLTTPDMLDGEGSPSEPAQPAMLIEWRLRRNHTASDDSLGPSFYGDVYDLRNPERPKFYVIDFLRRKIDYPGVTNVEGEDYPWRRMNGEAFIPASIRHSKAHAAGLFETWYRSETLGASYESALREGAIGQSFLNIAWPYGYTVDAVPMGFEEVKDNAGNKIARRIPATPGAMMSFESSADGRTGQVGVLDMAADLVQMEEALGMFLARAAGSWGLEGDDLWKTDGRSGAALSLSQGAKRKVQHQRAPIYRDADERLLGMIAALLRMAEPEQFGDLPDTGWRVSYQLSPLSPQERAAIRDEADSLLEKGMISRAEYRARIMGEDITVARKRLAEIATEETANGRNSQQPAGAPALTNTDPAGDPTRTDPSSATGGTAR